MLRIGRPGPGPGRQRVRVTVGTDVLGEACAGRSRMPAAAARRPGSRLQLDDNLSLRAATARKWAAGGRPRRRRRIHCQLKSDSGGSPSRDSGPPGLAAIMMAIMP